jgi:hypothetical protein
MTKTLGRAVKAVFRTAVAAGVLFAVTGCVSAPKRTASELWPVLPPDQALYLSVHLDGNRPFIHELLKSVEQDTLAMRFTVDRTEAVAASLDFSEPGKPDLSMISAGSYPGALVGWQMFWDKTWRSKKGTHEGERYLWWENEEDGLQMAVRGGRLALVSNGGIGRLLSLERSRSGAVVPEQVRTAAERADLLVYTPSPANVFTGGAIERQLFLAMNEFWVSLERVAVEDGSAVAAQNEIPIEYGVSGAFTLRDERAARVYGAIVKIAFAAWMNRMGIGNLRTVQEQLQVRTEGALLTFYGLRIPEEALLRLVTELYRGAAAAPEAAAAPGR